MAVVSKAAATVVVNKGVATVAVNKAVATVAVNKVAATVVVNKAAVMVVVNKAAAMAAHSKQLGMGLKGAVMVKHTAAKRPRPQHPLNPHQHRRSKRLNSLRVRLALASLAKRATIQSPSKLGGEANCASGLGVHEVQKRILSEQ